MACLMQRMRTPLHLAALQGDAASVMGLCTYKAKVNLKDEHALTPLHKAAAQGHSEAAEELLAHNANPNATDEVMFMLPGSHAGIMLSTNLYSNFIRQEPLGIPTAYCNRLLQYQYDTLIVSRNKAAASGPCLSSTVQGHFKAAGLSALCCPEMVHFMLSASHALNQPYRNAMRQTPLSVPTAYFALMLTTLAL